MSKKREPPMSLEQFVKSDCYTNLIAWHTHLSDDLVSLNGLLLRDHVEATAKQMLGDRKRVRESYLRFYIKFRSHSRDMFVGISDRTNDPRDFTVGLYNNITINDFYGKQYNVTRERLREAITSLLDVKFSKPELFVLRQFEDLRYAAILFTNATTAGDKKVADQMFGIVMRKLLILSAVNELPDEQHVTVLAAMSRTLGDLTPTEVIDAVKTAVVT